MTKKEVSIEKALEIIDKSTKNTGGLLGIVKTNADSIEKIVNIIEFQFKATIFTVSMLAYLVSRETINQFVQQTNQEPTKVIKIWLSLSENWQIFIMSIPTLVLTQVIGSLIFDKIKPSVKKL